jgi:hypothetical protein
MSTRLACWLLLSLGLVLGAAPRAAAQPAAASPPGCQLRVATGQKGKHFSRLLRDIVSVCGAQVSVCELPTEGGLHNSVALSANEADLGFVQLDTLQSMRDTDTSIGALRAVLPASENLLHIVVLRTGFKVQGERSLSHLFRREEHSVVPARASELRGLPVALVGSAQLLVRAVDRAYNLELHMQDAPSDDRALAALRAGEVAAVLTMSGWPAALLEQQAREGDLALAAYDLPLQAPYQVVHKNYPKLGVYGMAFLAAPNLLVTRPFKPDGERGRLVASLQRCVLANLDDLREGAYEPAWKALKNPAESYGWPRFGGLEEVSSRRSSE